MDPVLAGRIRVSRAPSADLRGPASRPCRGGGDKGSVGTPGETASAANAQGGGTRWAVEAEHRSMKGARPGGRPAPASPSLPRTRGTAPSCSTATTGPSTRSERKARTARALRRVRCRVAPSHHYGRSLKRPRRELEAARHHRSQARHDPGHVERPHPLYYYEDGPRRQVLCQDVVGFGRRWVVVDPSGTRSSSYPSRRSRVAAWARRCA